MSKFEKVFEKGKRMNVLYKVLFKKKSDVYLGSKLTLFK